MTECKRGYSEKIVGRASGGKKMKRSVKSLVSGLLVAGFMAANVYGAVNPAEAGGYAGGMLDPGSDLVTLAGVPGDGKKDGSGQEARFAGPMGIDTDGRTVIIADTDNNQIRSCHGNRVVSRAGAETGQDEYGHALGGYRDGYVDQSVFDKPSDCAFLPDGRIAIADRENHSIRILEKNYVYTLGGSGKAGYRERGPVSNGTLGNDGENTSWFNCPSGVAAGPNQILYVADTGNHCIRGIRRDGSSFLVAGIPGQGGYADGEALSARFMDPCSLAVGEDGAIYVADTGNQRIRRIWQGQVTTLAGTGTAVDPETGYVEPVKDPQEGIGFCYPQGICLAGNVVITADTGNHRICATTFDGETAVIAGTGTAGFGDGNLTEAQLHSPGDVVWENGFLYIMDSGNSALRVMRFDPAQWLGEHTNKILQ